MAMKGDDVFDIMTMSKIILYFQMRMNYCEVCRMSELRKIYLRLDAASM